MCSRGRQCRAVLGHGRWRSPGSCSADPVLLFRPHVFSFPEQSDQAVGRKGNRGPAVQPGLTYESSKDHPVTWPNQLHFCQCCKCKTSHTQFHLNRFLHGYFFFFFFGLQCTPLSSNNIQGCSMRQARIQITVKEITPCKIE